MERNVRAIFYEYKYYLLPDGVSFGDIISNKDAVKLTRLKEDLCMAPDFVYESMVEEEVEFAFPERAFEVTVNLYTCEEYDKILLEQVRRVCSGCVFYYPGPDDTDLDGHHREISLSGLCYERTEGGPDSESFLDKAHGFWWNVYDMIDELGKCIDSGDQKKLNKLLNKKLQSISYPLEFYGTVHDGKYCLCISTGRRLPFAYNSIVAYLAAAGQEDYYMKETDWEIIPYYKKGIFRYDGKKSFDDGPALYLEPSDFPFTFTVNVYTPNPDKLSGKKSAAILSEVRDRICEAIGEDLELLLINGYVFGADADKAESIDKVVNKLLDEYKSQVANGEQSDEEDQSFPRNFIFGADTTFKEEDYLPHRYKIQAGGTSAFDITLCPIAEIRSDLWWTDFFTFAYLVFPENVLGGLWETFQWYIENSKLIPEPIGGPRDRSICAKMIGACEGNGLMFIDNLAFDEKALLRKIRILSPLFEGKGVRLVTVNADGIKEYKCGFDMTVVSEKRWENK